MLSRLLTDLVNIILSEEGEVYSSPAVSTMSPNFTRIPAIQNAKSVFTDFKASNFAYLQNVYRFVCDLCVCALAQ